MRAVKLVMNTLSAQTDAHIFSYVVVWSDILTLSEVFKTAISIQIVH